MGTMFETYGFAGAFIQVQAVLTLYAQGLLTGLVVDSGDGVTHVVPVVDGFAFPHLTKRLNVAGRHITSHLVDLLQRRGYAFNRSADMDTVRQIKESLCYVSYDYKRDLQLGRETTHLMKSYTLPDGRVIKLGPERFMAPEALFSPDLIDVEGGGIADVLFKCIQEMDIDNRMVRACCAAMHRCVRLTAVCLLWQTMYEHVVLSGGSSMYPGLPSRLEKELRRLYLTHVLKGNEEGMRKLKLKIEDPPRRKHMARLRCAALRCSTRLLRQRACLTRLLPRCRAGVPGRGGAGGHHEGQARVLGQQAGVGGGGRARAGQKVRRAVRRRAVTYTHTLVRPKAACLGPHAARSQRHRPKRC